MNNKYVITGALVFFFVFIPTSLLLWNIFYGFIAGLFVTLTILPLVVIPDLLGKKKHISIHKSRLFSKLYLSGFKKETYGKYLGLTKTIDGRTIRIYYDWKKLSKGFFSFGDIVINVFFEPLVTDLIEWERDYDRIEELNNKYSRDPMYGYKRIFLPDRIRSNISYYPWTDESLIQKVIQESLHILREANLAPFDINNLTEELKDHGANGVFFPDMELIWNEQIKNAKHSKEINN